ncbi:DUF4340 domain-containing protein [Porticoccus litoralis]|uniref:DUF4340 domain-containing protein n=1 Tax=Porticoccus litoralis TaxID=434086 RepID=A0AAW8B0A2_9GAMM|nr:DUF4340 domain-containing protein [Porticoccus litoralis]MDP1519413.1 DUF4340 domain-containing protein [Porticoccus litoralis]TNE88216.1 MAG: DUF4340 domain-containing protein [Gammaproteobacteria bacterium]
MTKMKTWLSALLVAQLALAIGFYWNTQQELQKSLPKPLVDISWKKVDRFVVGDGNQQVALSYAKDSWLLSDLGMLPTVDGNAEQLLEKLQALQTSWPVASTQASHARFDVTEDKLQRFVAFYHGDELLGKLIVGSSPGLKKLHVRMDGQDNVYSVDLELVDMITASQAWLDNSLLKLDELVSIQGADYRLQKQGEDWVLQGQNNVQGLELDSGKVGDMLYALKDLRVRKLVTDMPDLAGSGYAQLSVETDQSEKPLIYQFYMTKENCYVTRNDYDAMFTIDWGDYEKIAAMDAAKLTVQPAANQESSQEDNSNEQS